jgi:hypothetical protein
MSCKKHSLTGSECAIVKVIFPLLLDILFPADLREGGPEFDEDIDDKYNKTKCVFDQWCLVLWPILKDTSIEKETKAELVRTGGSAWIRYWVDAHGTSQHLYPHLMITHYADQIRDLPVDPWYYQTQPTEHRHSWRKAWLIKMTNSHKDVGTSRTMQCMRLSVTKDYADYLNSLEGGEDYTDRFEEQEFREVLRKLKVELRSTRRQNHLLANVEKVKKEEPQLADQN